MLEECFGCRANASRHRHINCVRPLVDSKLGLLLITTCPAKKQYCLKRQKIGSTLTGLRKETMRRKLLGRCRMQITIATLTRQLAADVGEILLSLNTDRERELWTMENLLLDLPLKWEFSSYALISGLPVGYAIASLKEGAVHLHRIAVGENWRNKGIGQLLICDVASKAQKASLLWFTLKTYRSMSGVIEYYRRRGFEITNLNTAKNDVIMMRAHIEDVISKCPQAIGD